MKVKNVNIPNEGVLDAFGDDMKKTKGSMPQVLINGKQIALRTMFHEHECQKRYLKIDDGSYPVSAKNRIAFAGAARYIAAPEQKKFTWDTILDSEFLFVYPSVLPDIPVRFTAIFGSSSSNRGNHTKARFEAESKQFISTLAGISTAVKPEYINIFILKKTDANVTSKRGRIIFTHNSPEQLVQAAEDWSIGCHNIPRLDIGEPIIPFPLEIANIMNTVWKQNGERADGKTPVTRMKYYQGMELLLDILPTNAIHNFLHIQIENTSGLVNYIGNKIHCGGKCDSNLESRRLDAQKFAAARIFSVLGLFLFKCNVRKETYMEGFAYLLGQLLHVSDELHLLYCKVKRNGDIPPQLVGSALFVTAGEIPFQAIAQMGIRINPYREWANQYWFSKLNKDRTYNDANENEEKQRRQAKRLLNLYKTLSDQIIPQMDKSIRFGSFEKAQLFIGYMASLPKREGSDETIENNEITGGMDNE
jgi:hypothetical protein